MSADPHDVSTMPLAELLVLAATWARSIGPLPQMSAKLAMGRLARLARSDLAARDTCDGEHHRAHHEADRSERQRSLLIAGERDVAQVRIHALREAARALVDALPKCDHCSAPATKATKRGGGRWCDEHGPHDADYPRAAPLRALVKLLVGGE